jgi:hypothetical protein
MHHGHPLGWPFASNYTPDTREVAPKETMSDTWDRLDEAIAGDRARGMKGQPQTDDVHSRVELAELSCRNSIGAVYATVFEELCQELERRGYPAESKSQVTPYHAEASMRFWRPGNRSGDGVASVTLTCVAGQLVPAVLVQQSNGGFAPMAVELPVTPQNVRGWLQDIVEAALTTAP